MSDSAIILLGMAVLLSAMMASIALMSGLGIALALAAYAVGGSSSLLLMAYSAFVQAEAVERR
jgi:hypothetical protein